MTNAKTTRRSKSPAHSGRKPKQKTSKSLGTHVIWPHGLETMLDLSPVSRWRWERSGKLPPRDVNIGGQTGWKPETIHAALQGC